MASLKTIGCNLIIPVLATIKDKHKIHIIAISIDITTLLIIDANGCNCKSPGSNIYIRKASTAVSKALRYFNNSTKQKSIAFVLSDFIDANYEDALRIAAKKHDVIGIKIYDRMDKQLPDAGLLQVKDAESGATKWVDSSNAFVRYSYEQEFFRITEYSTQAFKKAGCDLLHVKTGEDYVRVLQRFFRSRNKQK